MALLPVLSERAASTSSALVRCGGCIKCCEKGGPVYVRDSEVPLLRDLNVPLVQIDGTSFIERLPSGACPMLDDGGRKCRIYEARPLCCRLFPLDIFEVSAKLRWALYVDCPEDRKTFSASQSLDSLIGLGTIGKFASVLESFLGGEDLGFFRAKEKVSRNIDILEKAENKRWKIISEPIADSERSNAQAQEDKEREAEG